jgi:hypothetical protein
LNVAVVGGCPSAAFFRLADVRGSQGIDPPGCHRGLWPRFPQFRPVLDVCFFLPLVDKTSGKPREAINVRKGFPVELIWVCMVLFLLVTCGCTKKKTTAPIEPTIFLMKDYFPSNEGDEWTWEASSDTVMEPFTDGDVNLGEPFVDLNKNGFYDFGEPFTDSNLNGQYDGPNDPWSPGIPYIDRNSNGQYDPPNGVYDEGEFFIDCDGNGVWNIITTVILSAHIVDSQDSLGIRETKCYRPCEENGPWGGGWLETDAFSNDSLGLRWHGHADTTDTFNFLAGLNPINIASASPNVGEVFITVDTFYVGHGTLPILSWISVFEKVEDITVPAGTFEKCLKFKSLAWGWVGNMYRYNGISYQWYAKDVGLVKSEGPGDGEYRILKSAKIKGKNYP